MVRRVEIGLGFGGLSESAVAPAHLHVAVDRVVLAAAVLVHKCLPAHLGLAGIVAPDIEPLELVDLSPLLRSSQ